MTRYKWKSLNKIQVGTYAEYFVKMELTMHGFQVYTTEVDDRGIDFVTRATGGRFIEVQVKSSRGTGYIFMEKTKFLLSQTLHLALVLFIEGEEPVLYMIPSIVWNEPNSIFVSRDYDKEGQKSKPEWGINLSQKNLSALEPYRFEKTLASLRESV